VTNDARRMTYFYIMAFFRDKFRAIFQIKETPHKIALAFALGVFMGISPFLGLHYIGGIFIAWLFRLNKLVAIIGVSVNNPWTIVPICSGATWIGAELLGYKQVLPEIDWGSISLVAIINRFSELESFMELVNQMMPVISAFFVGSFILCIPSTLAGYFIIRSLVNRNREVHGA